MEPHHHDQQENSGRNNSVVGSRQTSTRWTPTGEQIRILKELFYNNEIRSPSAEQIHRITARLRQYGRIEGKNVFYWFQNHKARNRAKKKSPANTTMPMHHKNPHYQHFHGASSSSSTLSTVGRMGSNNMNYGYGSTVTDNSFGEDSSNSSSGGEQYPSFDRTNPMQFFSEGYTSTVIETLPLFPMHGDEEEEEEEEDEDENGGSSFGYYTGNPNQNGAWYGSESGWMHGSRASLELSLNSYSFK